MSSTCAEAKDGAAIAAIAAENPADTHPRVHRLIRSRWSPRGFSDRDVAAEDLEAILEAGRWAASSFNEQPWRVVVATKRNRAAYERLLQLLVPGNQVWAGSAPVLMIMAAKRTFSHNGAVNGFALHDVGQALAQMSLQATALGLHTHSMGGFDRERARKELGIPDDYEIASAVALGYAAPPEQGRGAERPELRPRKRKPLNEIVFEGEWNHPLSLAS